ncbi:MAG TPA: hypothetical protein VHC49_25625 [Mycobacteriales bacterium]|nr:hypothetical protein [Mycobacteriales bacterium]
MGYISGLFFIAVGVWQIARHERMARTHAGSSDPAFNVLAARPAYQRVTRRMNLLSGVLVAALGLLILVAVIYDALSC